MNPVFRAMIRNRFMEFLQDDSFLDDYFENKTAAQKKQAQLDYIDAKIAAIQTKIDNIDDEMALIKSQKLSELNATKTGLNAFKTFWETTPE